MDISKLQRTVPISRPAAQNHWPMGCGQSAQKRRISLETAQNRQILRNSDGFCLLTPIARSVSATATPPILLAIDPSITTIGYCYFTRTGDFRGSGEWSPRSKGEERYRELACFVHDTLLRYGITSLVLERPPMKIYKGRSADAILTFIRAVGAIEGAVYAARCRIHHVAPDEWKPGTDSKFTNQSSAETWCQRPVVGHHECDAIGIAQYFIRILESIPDGFQI